MTLIIAGYDHKESVNYGFLGADTSSKSRAEMEPCGVFAISDSAITDVNGRALLNGFRKTYQIEAKLWKPYFQPDGSFKDYLQVYESQNVIMGFSGGTLTAQHILNSINEHLSQLRISCSDEDRFSPITYEVIRHCQPNPLREKSRYWDNDTFLDRDFSDLLTGSVIAEAVEHSINKALKSATHYKLSPEKLESMTTDFFCATWCRRLRRYELYEFRMQTTHDEDGALYGYTEKRLVDQNEVIVLGMRDRFEDEALRVFTQSITQNLNPFSQLVEYTGQCIDLVDEEGDSLIDRPIFSMLLDKNKVKEAVIKD